MNCSAQEFNRTTGAFKRTLFQGLPDAPEQLRPKDCNRFLFVFTTPTSRCCGFTRRVKQNPPGYTSGAADGCLCFGWLHFGPLVSCEVGLHAQPYAQSHTCTPSALQPQITFSSRLPAKLSVSPTVLCTEEHHAVPLLALVRASTEDVSLMF